MSKEVVCYEKEVVQLTEKVGLNFLSIFKNSLNTKVDKMAASPEVDEYVLRKQKEVLQESKAMVPDCQRRLKVAVDDLTAVLVCFEFWGYSIPGKIEREVQGFTFE